MRARLAAARELGGGQPDRAVSCLDLLDLAFYSRLAAPPRVRRQTRRAVCRLHARYGAPRHCEAATNSGNRLAGRAPLATCRRPCRHRCCRREAAATTPVAAPAPALFIQPGNSTATAIAPPLRVLAPRPAAALSCRAPSLASARPLTHHSLLPSMQGLIIVAIFLPPLAVFIHENACNSRVRSRRPTAAMDMTYQTASRLAVNRRCSNQNLLEQQLACAAVGHSCARGRERTMLPCHPHCAGRDQPAADAADLDPW